MDKFPNFKVAELNESFKKNGYVIVPFLTKSECEVVLDYYSKNVEETKAEFSTTMNATDSSKKAEISIIFVRKIEVHLDEIIDGFKPYLPTFS
ncbi:MAG: hypothetical protein R2753_13120 [Chitinophagales bacterium]